MGKLGETLRATRESKQLSLRQAEADTKIRLPYLEALEEGLYSDLPAPVYARAYIHTYAQYLGLDPEELIAQFNEECSIVEPRGIQSEVRIKGPGPVISLGPIITIAVILIVIAAIFYLYQQYSLVAGNSWLAWGNENTATGTAVSHAVLGSPTATSTMVSTPTPTVTQVPTVKLQVKTIERCWLQVGVDGTKVYTGTMEAGETQTWTGKDKIEVRAGNPSGVEITLNDRNQGRLAAYGTTQFDYVWTASPNGPIAVLPTAVPTSIPTKTPTAPPTAIPTEPPTPVPQPTSPPVSPASPTVAAGATAPAAPTAMPTAQPTVSASP